MTVLTLNDFGNWVSEVLRRNEYIDMYTLNNEIINIGKSKYIRKNCLENVFNMVKGDIFEYLTKYVFKFSGKFKDVYMYNELSNDFKDELELPHRDEGIDLVCMDNDNKYIGIQCKWRKEITRTIKKCYVAELYLVIKTSKLDHGIMCSNVINPNLHKSINRPINMKPVNWFVHKNFNKVINRNFLLKIVDDIDRTLKTDMTNINTNRIILRNYQKEAVNSLLNSENKNKQCIMACGTGKTIVMFEYLRCKYNYEGKILFLLPSLSLINQTYRNFMNYVGKNIDTLCICSQKDGSKEELNKLMTKENNIYTTKKKIIDNKMEDSKNLVVFCTYQSSNLLVDKDFNVGIFDEAHRTINNSFGLLLENENCRINERLYFTATPKYYIGNESDIVSMDNSEMYGEIVYNYTFGQAIRDKYILDYCISFYVAKKNMENEILEKIDMDDRTIISAIQLAQHIKKNDYDMKILSFHNKVENSYDFKKVLAYVFEKYEIKANIFVMHGNQKINERNKIINEFTNSNIPSIICSSQILTTGIDIPCVNTIMFVDPRNSITEVTQICGRGMRLHNNSEKVNIIIPIYYDYMNEEHDYNQVINVLMAMDKIDSNIEDNFEISNKTEFISSLGLFEKNEIIENLREKIEIDDIINNLRNKIIDRKNLSFKKNKDIWRKTIISENKRRYKNNMELIDTRKKCRGFLKENGITEEFDTINWVKYCLGKKLFEEMKKRYYYTKKEIIDACKELNIYYFSDYENLYKEDEKLPSPEYVKDGFYGDIDDYCGITSLLDGIRFVEDDCF